MIVNLNTSLIELFEIVKGSLNVIEEGEVFIVKDLFRGFEWNRISKGNRSKLGSMVFAFSQNEGNKIIIDIEKTLQNQRKYRKS
ncbi:DUF1413 domain-containing protein [Clostridium sp.]|uniref:DUF1413 domain-containing protein n=1 Tax=Clostridium sp. TaxID=1506 RepID=UPI00260A7F8D|nr:DUF1413 domain-containing protein [uncultured Clostridium sp.]